MAEVEEEKPFGLPTTKLSRDQVLALEPHLGEIVHGAVHYSDPLTTPDPHALTESYAALFAARGGVFVAGDALTLAPSGGDWTLQTAVGPLAASAAVVALGPVDRRPRQGVRLTISRSASSAATTCTTRRERRPRSSTGRCSMSSAGYVLTPMPPRRPADDRGRIRPARRPPVHRRISTGSSRSAAS